MTRRRIPIISCKIPLGTPETSKTERVFSPIQSFNSECISFVIFPSASGINPSGFKAKSKRGSTIFACNAINCLLRFMVAADKNIFDCCCSLYLGSTNGSIDPVILLPSSFVTKASVVSFSSKSLSIAHIFCPVPVQVCVANIDLYK